MEQLETSIFQFIVKNKQKIVKAFQVFYFIYILIFAWAVHAVYTLNNSYIFVITNAVNLGRIALVVFCLALFSGILRRFGVLKKISAGLLLIRRHLGITTFLFTFGHYFLLRGLGLITGQRSLSFPPLFELFGVVALIGLTIMFFTSNDYSVRKLGKKWNMLHKIVYGIAWIIFFHVALQRISIWSVLIGVFAVLEVVSLIVNFYRMNSKKPPSPPTSTAS